MSIKNILAVLSVFLICAVATGCGSSTSSSSEKNSEEIENNTSVVTTTEGNTEETTESKSEVSDNSYSRNKNNEDNELKLVPDGDVTSDKVKNLDFGVVTITNKETNIFEGTYRETIDDLNISFNYMGEHKHNTEDFYFDGNEHKGNFAFVYLECLKDGEIFIGHSDDRYNFNDTEIKALTAICSKENERNPDEILFYGGIHLNMLREEVEAILGEGVEGCAYTHFDEEFHSVIYKSETTSMVIGYRSQPDIFEEGKTIDFVYEINVINNR